MDENDMNVQTITVVGTGTMGLGIAQVSAMGGFKTILFDAAQAQIDKAIAIIKKNLMKAVELGKMAAPEVDAVMARIVAETDFEKAVRPSDMMIEAVPEIMDLKRDIFGKADRFMKKDAVLATNTSGLSITEIGDSTGRPDKVIGMHFFNPVHIMKLIEIVRSKHTSDATFKITEAVSHQMKKETVEVKESAGFVTSRVNALIGNEAFRMWEAGIATPEDIDKALKLGLNHPMGPFELVDLVGLDVRSASLGNLEKHLGPTYKPCPIILDLVKAGRLGKKVGHGVYKYDDKGNRIPGSSSRPS